MFRQNDDLSNDNHAIPAKMKPAQPTFAEKEFPLVGRLDQCGVDHDVPLG
jgi:hypothetical protein